MHENDEKPAAPEAPPGAIGQTLLLHIPEDDTQRPSVQLGERLLTVENIRGLATTLDTIADAIEWWDSNAN